MHTLLMEHKHRIKDIIEEELEEAIEEEDIDAIHKCCEIIWMYHDTKALYDPYHNPHYNPARVEGTADIKTMAPMAHGHGYGTVQFTTTKE